jgi:hypothetical protein
MELVVFSTEQLIPKHSPYSWKGNNVKIRLCYFFNAVQANNKLRGLSPQANYTDRATALCRRS